MFALEIDFHDGISPPETILVRRSNAIIGSGEMAHVVIEGATSSLCELRLVRGLGREFSCYPVRRPNQPQATPPFIEGSYVGTAELKLGDITLHVTSLDADLMVQPEEFPDRAAVRVLQSSLTRNTTVFPAIAVMAARPVYLSFPEEMSLLIGRSRKCALRLDASDVSSEHARAGIDGGKCWIEDLGSTNGTFVGEEKVSGRRYLEQGETIRVGAEFILTPILSVDDVSSLNSRTVEFPETTLGHTFPCLVSQHDEIRPSRFPLKGGAKVTIGRDPANDIWISSAHISRRHVEVLWNGEDSVEVVDYSSNGAFLGDERLPKGVPVVLTGGLSVIDFASGVLLGVCFSEDDETNFSENYADRILEPEVDESAPIAINTMAVTGAFPETRDIFDAISDEEPGFESPEEDVRRVLERAAGISDQYAQEDESEESVFERMARINANRGHDSPEAASEYVEGDLLEGDIPQNLAEDFPEVASGDLGFENLQDSDSSGELSDFERFQQEQLLQGGADMFDSEREFALMDGDFDEDLLKAGGLGRGFWLIVGLVIVFLVLLSLFILTNG